MDLFAMNRRDTLKTLLVAPYAVVADAAGLRTSRHTEACLEESSLLVLCIGRVAEWVFRESSWLLQSGDFGDEMRQREWSCRFDSYASETHDNLYLRKYTCPFVPIVSERMVEMQIEPSIRNILLLASDPWGGQPLIGDTNFPQREIDCNWAHKFAASASAMGIRIHPAILRDKARHAPAEIDRVLSIIERQVGFSSPLLRHEFSTANEQDIWHVPAHCGVLTEESHQFKLAALTLIEFIESTMRH